MKSAIAWILSGILICTSDIAGAKANPSHRDSNLSRNGPGLTVRSVLLSHGQPKGSLLGTFEQPRPLVRRSSEDSDRSPDEERQGKGDQKPSSQGRAEGTGSGTHGAEGSWRRVKFQREQGSREGQQKPSPFQQAQQTGVSSSTFQRSSEGQTRELQAPKLKSGRSQPLVPPGFSSEGIERQKSQPPTLPGASFSRGIPRGPEEKHKNTPLRSPSERVGKQESPRVTIPGVSFSKGAPRQSEGNCKVIPPGFSLAGVPKQDSHPVTPPGVSFSKDKSRQLERKHEGTLPSISSEGIQKQKQESRPITIPGVSFLDSLRQQHGFPGSAGLKPSPEVSMHLSHVPESWRKNFLKHAESQEHRPAVSPTEWSHIKQMDRQDSQPLKGTLRMPPRAGHGFTSGANLPRFSQGHRQKSMPGMQPALLAGQQPQHGQYPGIERHVSFAGFEPEVKGGKYDQYLRDQVLRHPPLRGKMVSKINSIDRRMSGRLPHAISVPSSGLHLSGSPHEDEHANPRIGRMAESKSDAPGLFSKDSPLKWRSPRAQSDSQERTKEDSHSPASDAKMKLLRKRTTASGVSGDASGDKHKDEEGSPRKGGDSDRPVGFPSEARSGTTP